MAMRARSKKDKQLLEQVFARMIRVAYWRAKIYGTNRCEARKGPGVLGLSISGRLRALLRLALTAEACPGHGVQPSRTGEYIMSASN